MMRRSHPPADSEDLGASSAAESSKLFKSVGGKLIGWYSVCHLSKPLNRSVRKTPTIH